MKRTIWLILAFLLIQLLVGSIASLASIHFHLQPTSASVMSTTLLIANTLIILATWIILRPESYTFSLYPSSAKNNVTKRVRYKTHFYLLALLTMCPLIISVNALSELLNAPDLFQEQFETILSNPIGIITVIIIGPIAEEMLFRKGIISSLLRNAQQDSKKSKTFMGTPLYAMLISSVLFALVHGNPIQMIGGFCVGLYLSFIYVKTHNLTMPVLCHIFNNLSSVILFYILPHNFKLIDLAGSNAILLIWLLISALIVLISVYYINNKSLTPN